jgi:hypothetical protein
MLQSTESFYLNQLKIKLEEKIGFKVLEFQDCRKLSDLLNNDKITVSAHTIARFYGILKEAHRPYTSTLNLLANFSGYEGYASFCSHIRRSDANALANSRGISTGDFSFTALELAIQMNDWKNVQILLDSFDFTCGTEKNNMTMFLGNAVRQHPSKYEFLKALTEIENGRHFFFESFVDEDDPGYYYSTALKNYYLKKKNEFESNLFYTCYINARKIYLNQFENFDELNPIWDSALPFDKMHFHQISRTFELRILSDSLKGKLKTKIDYHLSDVLNILPTYSPYEKSWILARTIKALSFSKHLAAALEINDFKNAIYTTYLELQGRIESIAELIIQLTVHSFPKIFDNKTFPPARIREKHLNETNARISIESATALLYAEEPVKKVIESNLFSFADKTGNGWIKNLKGI